MSVFDPPGERRDALRTDLYQLTMIAAMHAAGLDHVSSFELFTRRLAPSRGYWIACGLELGLDYLEGLRFTGPQIDWLRAHPAFAAVAPDFFAWLRDFRFQGEVWAVPEGTPVFPWEPLVRVTGPAAQAQLVETWLLSTINFQTLIASKAARVARACRGKKFVDFGTRRAHGPEAAELVARATWVGGAWGTSNVEAAQRLGIPCTGTFAHAWVMQFEDELEAFRRYARVFPRATTLLIDTYDTVAAARRIVAEEVPCQAVRLDSGDLTALSIAVREVFDRGGRPEVKVVASGDLDELKIDAMERAGARIDTYGVGTELATSRDHPALGGVYKLVETRGADGEVRHPVKLAADKASWPGLKQVWRREQAGRATGDLLGLADEPTPPGARPLLECVMREGRRTRPAPALEQVRARCADELARLPEPVQDLIEPGPYPVERTAALEGLAARARELAQAANTRPNTKE